MPQDKIKLETHYYFPSLISFPLLLVSLAFISYNWSGIKSAWQTPTKFTLALFFFGLYSLHYFFYVSLIKIVDYKLYVPSLNYRAYPDWFGFKKRVIDINSITKIIVYPQKADTMFMLLRNAHTQLPDAKIVVFAENHTNIAISNNFYGDDQIQEMVAVLCNRNENIQLIEFGSD